jgi:hypothetical protein
MSIVLAALGSDASAGSVLASASRLGALTGNPVEAVHVREGPTDIPEWLTARHDVPLRILGGPAGSTLLAAVMDPAVVAAVFGARAKPGGRRPVGCTAMHVLERTRKPTLVVPPDFAAGSARAFRRLVVPLEGTEEASRAVTESLLPLIDARVDVDVVVLHVFTPATVPRVLDRPARDLDLWADEFVARHCPAASRIVLRSGHVGGRVAEVCTEQDADLVVLSWSQDSSPGRAAVIRDLLAHTAIPVLLLPVNPGAG